MIIFPFLARLVYFTSGFGPRWGGIHRGCDYAAVIGTVFHAPIDGRIVRPAFEAGGAGLNVWVVGDNGDIWKCFHLSEILLPAGTRVTAGQAVALTGNTGASTGPHAHVEYWPGGVTAVDPYPLLHDAELAGRFPGAPVIPADLPTIITIKEFLTMARIVQVAGRDTISFVGDPEASLPGLSGIDGQGPGNPGRLVGGVYRFDYPNTALYALVTGDYKGDNVHTLDPATEKDLIDEYDKLPVTVQAA